MQMFLALGVVEKYRYDDWEDVNDSKGRETINDIRLVHANDLDDAKVKYYKFWNGKSIDYEVTYYVAKIDMIETLI